MERAFLTKPREKEWNVIGRTLWNNIYSFNRRILICKKRYKVFRKETGEEGTENRIGSEGGKSKAYSVYTCFYGVFPIISY